MPPMRRIAAVTAIAVAAALAVALVFDRLPTSNSSQPSGPLTAAIIDQASLTQPNPALAESATAILERAGYTVDYYPGEQVTVDFYRDLPTLGYDLLIVRTHSGLYLDGIRTDEAFLFTSEPYSQTEHLDDQRARRLIKASYYTEGLSVDLDPPDPPAGLISSPPASPWPCRRPAPTSRPSRASRRTSVCTRCSRASSKTAAFNAESARRARYSPRSRCSTSTHLRAKMKSRNGW